MLLPAYLLHSILLLLHVHVIRAAEAVAGQLAGYLVVFAILRLIFQLQYEQPFWRSLAWSRIPVPPTWIVIAGWLTAFAVVLTGYLIHVPTTSNPMTELMSGRAAMILIGVFGVTLGPLAEELAFRGLLQPLLVRTCGAVAGILLTTRSEEHTSELQSHSFIS